MKIDSLKCLFCLIFKKKFWVLLHIWLFGLDGLGHLKVELNVRIQAQRHLALLNRLERVVALVDQNLGLVHEGYIHGHHLQDLPASQTLEQLVVQESQLVANRFDLLDCFCVFADTALFARLPRRTVVAVVFVLFLLVSASVVFFRLKRNGRFRREKRTWEYFDFVIFFDCPWMRY